MPKFNHRIGFALSLLIPSTAIVHKVAGQVGSAGQVGVIAYLLVAAAALWMIFRYWDRVVAAFNRLNAGQIRLLATLTFLLLLLVFLILYPLANSTTPGRGSDNDDALGIAVGELLHGRYPYYPRTYLGNLISPLPGALLLAVPFVLLGNVGYQSIFWLVVFFWLLCTSLRDERSALRLLWLVLALSPIVVYKVIVGSDYPANAVYVIAFVLWTIAAHAQATTPRWQQALAAVLLGIGLSSRANFIVLVPLIFSALVQRAGRRAAVRAMALTLLTFTAITLPFYFYDPAGFSPLHTASKLAIFQVVLPQATAVITLAMAVLALTLALGQRVDRDLGPLWRNSALVLAFPVVCGMILPIVVLGRPLWEFAAYGTFFLFFGVLGYGGDLSVGLPHKAEEPAIPWVKEM